MIPYASPQFPWDRQSGEGLGPYKAFRAFLEGGPDRSLVQAAEVVGRAVPTLKRYSSVHKWKARAKAWDEHNKVEPPKIPKVLDLQKVQAEQLASWAQARELATLTIKRTLEAYKGQDTPPTTIKDAIALLKEATTYERLIIGLATSRDESVVESTDLSALTVEELESLLLTAAKAGLV